MAIIISASASFASTKTVPIYSHPKAVAAPTNPVEVRDLDNTGSELEAIIGKSADPSPPLPAATRPTAPAAAPSKKEVAVPPPIPPVQIIPPPSEILPVPDEGEGVADTLRQWQQWAQEWRDLVNALVMMGIFLFAGLLYLTSRGQYVVLKRAVKVAEKAAVAARESAEAAQIAASVTTMIERAYVFLEPNIHGSVNAAGEQGDPAQFTIKFAFRNYGKTPAIVVDLQASGSYWSAGYPEALFADSHAAGEGMMIAPGEKSSTFTLVFTVNVQDLQQAYNGHGQLLFWGKLLYRDMFGELRETAFCRAYRFDDKAFRVVQVDKLNYHT